MYGTAERATLKSAKICQRRRRRKTMLLTKMMMVLHDWFKGYVSREGFGVPRITTAPGQTYVRRDVLQDIILWLGLR
jgi:hypothetical protein